MPQEEEEEAVSQVEEAAFLIRAQWCATMAANMMFFCINLLF